MAGGIVIAVLLLLFPIFVAIGGLVLAAILGTTLDVDAKKRFEGTEQLDLAG
jgi:hypothetical protein